MKFLKIGVIIFLIFPGPILQAQTTRTFQKKHKVLLIDGQNNHKRYAGFEEITPLLKGYLEETGLFSVDVATTPPEGESVANFGPDFENYDVVLSNYNGAVWPEKTQQNFEKFVRRGGGFIVIHAADNAFPKWDQYSRMIGLGWGDRSLPGKFVYYDDEGKKVEDFSPGHGGHHGGQHEFPIKVRNRRHPITRSMPTEWLHAKEELYDHLRGPAEKMDILATAYSSKQSGGSGRHEPMMMTIRYGKGRVFHTPMGHSNSAVKCVGFKVTLQRATEWVATGKVTQMLPGSFPDKDKVSVVGAAH